MDFAFLLVAVFVNLFLPGILAAGVLVGVRIVWRAL